MSSLEVSEALSAKGATHPRVSLDDMNAAIAAENYLNAGDAAERCGQPGTAPMFLMTLCFLNIGAVPGCPQRSAASHRPDVPDDALLPDHEKRLRRGRQVGASEP